MASLPNLSPSSLFALIRVTLLVMLGRKPAIGSYDTSPAGVWQAVAASIVFTLLVTIYPGLEATPNLFFAALLLQLIGVVMLVLLINLLLKALGRPDKLLPFIVPFLWIENLQQLLGGIVQSLTVMTGDQTLMISILPVAVWTCYWLWRIGRDQLGRDGWYATGLIFLSIVIDTGLQVFLMSRVQIPVG